MSQDAQDQDLSIEEILSSIRQIISDDEDEPAVSSAANAADAKESSIEDTDGDADEVAHGEDPDAERLAVSKEETSAEKKDSNEDLPSPSPESSDENSTRANQEDSAKGHDSVLELTEKVQVSDPDGDVPEEDADDIDRLFEEGDDEEIDIDFDASEAEESESEEAEQEGAEPDNGHDSGPVMPEAIEEAAKRKEMLPPEEKNLEQDDGSEDILTGAAEAATLAAFSSLTETALPLGNQTTVEGIVRELLKPLLRDWLDKNMPPLVEKIMKDELHKIAEKARRGHLG